MYILTKISTFNNLKKLNFKLNKLGNNKTQIFPLWIFYLWVFTLCKVRYIQSLIRFDNILVTRVLLDQFRPALGTASFPDVRYTNWTEHSIKPPSERRNESTSTRVLCNPPESPEPRHLVKKIDKWIWVNFATRHHLADQDHWWHQRGVGGTAGSREILRNHEFGRRFVQFPRNFE